MYGKKDKQRSAFDLENELKETPTRAKEIIDKAEQAIYKIKQQLRQGTNEKDFDKLGTLLSGYAALQKVLKKVAK